jgi:hypothetical protein
MPKTSAQPARDEALKRLLKTPPTPSAPKAMKESKASPRSKASRARKAEDTLLAKLDEGPLEA